MCKECTIFIDVGIKFYKYNMISKYESMLKKVMEENRFFFKI